MLRHILIVLWLSAFIGISSLTAGEGTGGSLPSIRGIHWQWCFIMPDEAFMMHSAKAMKELGYNAVIPEFGPALYREKNGVSRELFRRYLKACRENCLEVIMLFNSLDHGERSPAWPARLASGIDLTEEKNYEYLFSLLDKVREDFAAAGMKLRYVHFGLDEAEKVMAANVKKSGGKPAELLLNHIRRLNDFCRSRDMRMIMWHDMIMGTRDADPASRNEFNYKPSMKVDAWKCRKDIPRDVIVMYWNYEPGVFSEPGNLMKEGFQVWLMPWGDVNAASMLKQAREEKFPALMLSTWMESGFYPGDSLPPANSIPSKDWMTAAIGCAVNRTPLEVVHAFFPVPADTGRKVFQAAEEEGMLLGSICTGSNLDELVQPLYVASGSIKEKIDGVNMPRGQDKLICYTPEFGKSTKCNGFGQEISVAAGQVAASTTWGVGDSAIPANGYVLSAHSMAGKKLRSLRIGSRASVVDSNGKALEARTLRGEAKAHFNINAKAAALECRWAITAEMPLDGKAVAFLEVAYADGKTHRLPLKAGRDILTKGAHKMFWGARENVRVWHGEQGFTGWRWTNPRPDVKVVSATLEIEDPAQNGLRIASISVL